MTPMIIHSELTDRWYVVTRWKQVPSGPDGKVRGIASKKYDVTDQMEAIFAAHNESEAKP